MSARRILGYAASIIALILGSLLLYSNLTTEVLDTTRYAIGMTLGGIGVAVGILGPILLKRFSSSQQR